MKKIRIYVVILLIFVLIASSVNITALADEENRHLTVLFTSDIHSYFETGISEVEGELREHGGAGRLVSLVKQYSNDHSIYVDAGDFSMGTLLHAGYATNAYELRLLGNAGCAATTFGNHEFDFGSSGAAQMLRSAKNSGDPLPELIIPANLQYSKQMTETQTDLANALDEIGSKRFIIREIDGIRVAVFSLMGKEAGMFAPTSGVEWGSCVEAAKAIVKEIGDSADVIICISHSGTKGDGKRGEDITLAKAVPEIDVVISGHSHTTYHEAVSANHASIGSCGYFLAYLGRMELEIAPDGSVSCTDYELVRCDENVDADPETQARVAGYREEINNNYLASQGLSYDTVLAHSDFNFTSLQEMYRTRDEYPMGELIADAYRYAYRQNDIDTDVAMVALGTIRGSIVEGDITAANAFEICSLGVGSDGSAGHAILSAYVSGADLKLIAELDAVAGDLIPNFRMCFSGLNYTYDKNRVPLDRVLDMYIEAEDGSLTPIESGKLYRVAINRYALNLLGTLKKKSFGLMNIAPRTEQGAVIEESDYDSLSLVDGAGKEVKEWKALSDYLMSFEKREGISIVPEKYSAPLGRKIMKAGSGMDLVRNPGVSTIIAMVVIILPIIWIGVLIATHKKRKARRAAQKEFRRLKREADKMK